MNHRRLLITWVLALISLYAYSVTDYRSKILGSWQCESSFENAQGKFRIEGITQLNPEGSILSRGNLYAYNTMINAELPMSYNAEGNWSFDRLILKGHLLSGNIETGIPVLNKLADLLEIQVTQKPDFSARLTRIGDKAMVFEADDGTQIDCKR